MLCKHCPNFCPSSCSSLSRLLVKRQGHQFRLVAVTVLINMYTFTLRVNRLWCASLRLLAAATHIVRVTDAKCTHKNNQVFLSGVCMQRYVCSCLRNVY